MSRSSSAPTPGTSWCCPNARADDRMAQPMSPTGQGLGMPEPERTGVPALGINPDHGPKALSGNHMISDRWGDWGLSPGRPVAAPLRTIERGPVWIGHKHRGGAAMGYFAGLDVSLEETAICIVDEAGLIVREARVASDPEALIAFFRATGMAMERVGLEACSLTAWLHQGLTEAGIAAICIEARQAKAAMGAMPNKTDRNDARGIAQMMRTGWYRAVHVKKPICRSWRALLMARRMVLNKRRDVENGVRALLREAGLKIGTPSRKNFAARVEELAADDPVLAALAKSLLSVIDVMTREVDRLTRRVLDEVRVEPTCRRD